MNIQMISNLETPIGEVLKAADDTGALIQSETQERYAVLPLDDELIDYLLERNPGFIEECAQIRQRMNSGESYSPEEVERLLAAQ